MEIGTEADINFLGIASGLTQMVLFLKKVD